MHYVIQSAGSQGGARVVDDRGAITTFPTRRAARAYADSITPDQPSKYLPLVVRKVEEAS
jgi:hypothetical protein